MKYWSRCIAEIQSVVTPITSKLYAGANAPGPEDEEDPLHDHDELW
jgi:heat shock protein 5